MTLLLLLAIPGFAKLLLILLAMLIFLGVLYWLVSTLAPEPLKKYGIALVVVVAAIFLIWFIMYLAGEASMPSMG